MLCRFDSVFLLFAARKRQMYDQFGKKGLEDTMGENDAIHVYTLHTT